MKTRIIHNPRPTNAHPPPTTTTTPPLAANSEPGRTLRFEDEEREKQVKALRMRKLRDSLETAIRANEPLEEIVQVVQQDPKVLAAVDGTGWTPLHDACCYGASLDVIRYLACAFPDALSTSTAQVQNTPLHLACMGGNVSRIGRTGSTAVEVVAFLTEKCRDALQMVNCHGDTPLHCACDHNAPLDVIRYMSQQYPDSLRIVDKFGFTPLHFACLHDFESFDVISYLANELLQLSNSSTVIAPSSHAAIAAAGTSSIVLAESIRRLCNPKNNNAPPLPGAGQQQQLHPPKRLDSSGVSTLTNHDNDTTDDAARVRGNNKAHVAAIGAAAMMQTLSAAALEYTSCFDPLPVASTVEPPPAGGATTFSLQDGDDSLQTRLRFDAIKSAALNMAGNSVPIISNVPDMSIASVQATRQPKQTTHQHSGGQQLRQSSSEPRQKEDGLHASPRERHRPSSVPVVDQRPLSRQSCDPPAINAPDFAYGAPEHALRPRPELVVRSKNSTSTRHSVSTGISKTANMPCIDTMDPSCGALGAAAPIIAVAAAAAAVERRAALDAPDDADSNAAAADEEELQHLPDWNEPPTTPAVKPDAPEENATERQTAVETNENVDPASNRAAAGEDEDAIIIVGALPEYRRSPTSLIEAAAAVVLPCFSETASATAWAAATAVNATCIDEACASNLNSDSDNKIQAAPRIVDIITTAPAPVSSRRARKSSTSRNQSNPKIASQYKERLVVHGERSSEAVEAKAAAAGLVTLPMAEAVVLDDNQVREAKPTITALNQGRVVSLQSQLEPEDWLRKEKRLQEEQQLVARSSRDPPEQRQNITMVQCVTEVVGELPGCTSEAIETSGAFLESSGKKFAVASGAFLETSRRRLEAARDTFLEQSRQLKLPQCAEDNTLGGCGGSIIDAEASYAESQRLALPSSTPRSEFRPASPADQRVYGDQRGKKPHRTGCTCIVCLLREEMRVFKQLEYDELTRQAATSVRLAKLLEDDDDVIQMCGPRFPCGACMSDGHDDTKHRKLITE